MQDLAKQIENMLRLLRYRASEEARLSAELNSKLHAIDSEHAANKHDLETRVKAELQESKAEYEELIEQIEDEYEAHFEEAEQEYKDQQVIANREFSQEINDAEREYDEAKWMVNSVYDKGAEDSPVHRYEVYRTRTKKEREFLDTQAKELDTITAEAAEVLTKNRQGTDISVEVKDVSRMAKEELHELHVNSTEAAGNALSRLKKLWLPRQFSGIRPVFIAIIGFVIGFPATLVAKGADPMKLIDDPASIPSDVMQMAVGIGCGAAFLLCLVLYTLARGASLKHFRIVQEGTITAANTRRQWVQVAKKESEVLKKAAEKWAEEQRVHRRHAMSKAAAAKNSRVKQSETKRDDEIKRLADKYVPELERTTARRDRRLREADEKYPALAGSLDNRLKAQSELMTKQYEDTRRGIQARIAAEWKKMSDTWLQGYGDFSKTTDTARRHVAENFPDWPALHETWDPPKQPTDSIPIGHIDMRLNDLEGGLSNDQRLTVERETFAVPALLQFPNEMSLVIEAGSGGRDEGVDLLQTAMLRLLTSLPPGKVRFTIIDPVGLGENFSAFMHLADYDEVLVTSRIWTEEQQINKRLLDLTEHMENVFQTYLRNEFSTIQEYNEQAGEVAEPYHFLVVANFPFNFSDDAARRLTSIMSSGPRCGVHTLLTYDNRQDMPRGFEMNDIARHATCMQWSGDRFVWQHPVYKNLPLVLEKPPGPNEFSQIVRNVGDESRDARHVEVAFERIVPSSENMWSQDSRKGIDVPLGRAGATKLQHLRLGRGTSQHVMIAGKTGSGKSTLLHILITNMALHYSADEVEFYLIDFKKGVEFKTYANNRLPHARVIAIESDREFGLSVLQRLDEILAERGDIFRDKGVQDIGAYRDAMPRAKMPRLMLIIDEFQEFFVDDDQIGQKAGLLLDRLVRQGRAFGIHVLLGSQTLGGAYSLARSTMGQIAVRIALQCSEADSHLILSEENMAARLLSRPGEAIYNDSNGTVEGNHPFQIAWLGDEKRDGYLQRVIDERHANEVRPMVVFEGNIPAQPVNNTALVNTIRKKRHEVAPEAVRLWLGEPVAIKDSTYVPLRRQAGHNMLIVGQNESLARGTLLMSAISAASQVTPKCAAPNGQVAQFYVFTAGERSDADTVWATMAETLPHAVKQVGLRDTKAIVQELRDEIARRDADSLTDEPPIYIVLNGLSRFRDLRKDDDDFGFGGGGFGDEPKEVACSKVFAEVIKEGPSLGIHVLAWCDTYSNATRWLTTQSLREFELRVCFQMNSTDSSNIIDSPMASRLGPNRALLYVEEVGSAEKFRPYGTAGDDWVAQTARAIGGQKEPMAEVPAPAESEKPIVDKTADDEALDTLDGWIVE